MKGYIFICQIESRQINGLSLNFERIFSLDYRLFEAEKKFGISQPLAEKPKKQFQQYRVYTLQQYKVILSLKQ